MVTPEHNMVYLNKNDGRIKNCQAKEYTKGKGAFYRGCEYESEDVAFYEIDDIRIPLTCFVSLWGIGFQTEVQWETPGLLSPNKKVSLHGTEL